MNTYEALGGLPPVNGSRNNALPPQNIRGLVRKAIHMQIGGPIIGVDMETPIPDRILEPILKEIGEIMECSIVGQLGPDEAWTGSSLAQRIFERQSLFPKSPTAQ